MVEKFSKLSIISGILTVIWLVVYLLHQFSQIPYLSLILLILPFITIIISIISWVLIKKYDLKGKKIAIFSLIMNIVWIILLLSQTTFQTAIKPV